MGKKMKWRKTDDYEMKPHNEGKSNEKCESEISLIMTKKA